MVGKLRRYVHVRWRMFHRQLHFCLNTISSCFWCEHSDWYAFWDEVVVVAIPCEHPRRNQCNTLLVSIAIAVIVGPCEWTLIECSICCPQRSVHTVRERQRQKLPGILTHRMDSSPILCVNMTGTEHYVKESWCWRCCSERCFKNILIYSSFICLKDVNWQ